MFKVLVSSSVYQRPLGGQCRCYELGFSWRLARDTSGWLRVVAETLRNLRQLVRISAFPQINCVLSEKGCEGDDFQCVSLQFAAAAVSVVQRVISCTTLDSDSASQIASSWKKYLNLVIINYGLSNHKGNFGKPGSS